MKDIILASNSTFNILTKYTFEQSARSFRAFFLPSFSGHNNYRIPALSIITDHYPLRSNKLTS